MGRQSKSEAAVIDLLRRYEEICAVIRKLNTPGGNKLAGFLTESLAQVRTLLETKPRPVPLSSVAAGLRQGLREMPEVLRDISADIPPPARAKVWIALNHLDTSDFSAFLAQAADEACEVLRRGTIRNEEEWLLLRWRLDEIEGQAAHQEEVTRLYELLDTYEAAAGNAKQT